MIQMLPEVLDIADKVDRHDIVGANQIIIDLRAKLQAAERERDKAKSLVRLELDNLAKVGAVADKLRDERDALAHTLFKVENAALEYTDGAIAHTEENREWWGKGCTIDHKAILAEHDRAVRRKVLEEVAETMDRSGASLISQGELRRMAEAE